MLKISVTPSAISIAGIIASCTTNETPSGAFPFKNRNKKCFISKTRLNNIKIIQQTPLISVIIPVKNEADLLNRCSKLDKYELLVIPLD